MSSDVHLVMYLSGELYVEGDGVGRRMLSGPLEMAIRFDEVDTAGRQFFNFLLDGAKESVASARAESRLIEGVVELALGSRAES